MYGSYKYQNLWHGCIGAWCPSQDNSRSTLVTDFSSARNNATLNGMDPGTDWVASGNRIALDFDGTNDYANLGSNTNSLTQGVLSINGWFRLLALSTRAAITSNVMTGGANGFTLEIGRTASKLSWLQNGSTVDATSTGTVPDTGWHHISVVRTGLTGGWTITFYIDGVSSSHTTTINPVGSNGNLSLGRYGDFVAFGYAAMHCDAFQMHNRALSQSEINLLASRRGIAYDRNRLRVGRRQTVSSRNNMLIGCGL